MRFFKKIDITKEKKKLGEEYMPNGTIRVLNPYDLHKTDFKFAEGDGDNSIERIFKKVDTYKRTNKEFQDGKTENLTPEMRRKSRATSPFEQEGETGETSVRDGTSKDDSANKDDTLSNDSTDSCKLTSF